MAMFLASALTPNAEWVALGSAVAFTITFIRAFRAPPLPPIVTNDTSEKKKKGWLDYV